MIDWLSSDWSIVCITLHFSQLLLIQLIARDV